MDTDTRTARRYRKKPVVIEAIRWDGTNWNEVCDFLPVPDKGVGVWVDDAGNHQPDAFGGPTRWSLFAPDGSLILTAEQDFPEIVDTSPTLEVTIVFCVVFDGLVRGV